MDTNCIKLIKHSKATWHDDNELSINYFPPYTMVARCFVDVKTSKKGNKITNNKQMLQPSCNKRLKLSIQK